MKVTGNGLEHISWVLKGVTFDKFTVYGAKRFILGS